MRTLKKSLALVLALVMLLGLGVVGASADNALDNYTDADEIGDAYLEAVGVLTGLGIVDGMTETTIVPQATYTRAQAAKIITTMVLGVNGAKSCVASYAPFDDVAANHWAAGYIAFCKEQGIIDGVTDTTFDPEGTLTGYQWAKMLLAAVGFNANNELEGSSWSLNTARIGREVGLFDGDLAGADHTPLRREQAMLYAFNTLSAVRQVTWTTNGNNYVYDITFGNGGYIWADGTSQTLGEYVFDLAMVEGQIIDNEGMGASATVVDPVASRAKNVSIKAGTGLDLMYHAVRVWYVADKNNTGVYTYDLAKTTEYTCRNIATGDKAVKDLPKTATVETPSIGYDTGKTEYESYLIDNRALDLANDYAYVSLWADFGDMGRVGKDTTNVDGNTVDNDDVMTDVSNIKVGDSIVYVKAESTLSDGEAWYVYPVSTTEGVVQSIKKSAGEVISVTLTDGTELKMSAFWHNYGVVSDKEVVTGRNYSFVLDTHGDVILATRDYARDLYYYTGDSRPAHEFNAWSSDHTTEYRFLNVTTGEEYIVPLTDSSIVPSNLFEGGYYDISASATSSGKYVATKVTSGSNPYAAEYVIDNFSVNQNTVGVHVAGGAVTGDTVYFDVDEITFIIAKGSGENMTVETYNGIDELKTDYDVAEDGWFQFNNACFTVSSTTTDHKNASVVFIHEQTLEAYSNFVFVPENIDVNDWDETTGGPEGYKVTYKNAGYLGTKLIDVTYSNTNILNGTVIERGWYTYKFTGASGTYALVNKVTNGNDGTYYGTVDFIDTAVTGLWLINGKNAVDGAVVIVDCTGEFDDDVTVSVSNLYDYYEDVTDAKNIRLAYAFVGDDITYIYVTEEGYGSAATVTLSNELEAAGWDIEGQNADGEYVIKDAYNHPVTITLVNKDENLNLDNAVLSVIATNATSVSYTVNDNEITLTLTPAFSTTDRDAKIELDASFVVGVKMAALDDNYWDVNVTEEVTVAPGEHMTLVFTRTQVDTFSGDVNVVFTNGATVITVPATYNTTDHTLTVDFVPTAAGTYTVAVQQ